MLWDCVYVHVSANVWLNDNPAVFEEVHDKLPQSANM